MKVMRSYFWGLSALLMAGLFFVGCEKESVTPRWVPEQAVEVEQEGDIAKILTELSDAEVNSLNVMLEEERMGRDLFAFFMKIFPQKPEMEMLYWQEYAHELAIKDFMIQQSLDVDQLPSGMYNDTELQADYDWAVQNCQENIYNTLSMGGKSIERSINYLDNYLGGEEVVEHEGLRQVYTNIQGDAEEQLRFLVDWFDFFGVEYAPVILSDARFNKIMNTGK